MPLIAVKNQVFTIFTQALREKCFSQSHEDTKQKARLKILVP